MRGAIDVIVSPDIPKMRLSERVCEVLAPDFIIETNAWMLQFFGTTNAVGDGEVRMLPGGKAMMNPRTYAAFMNASRVRITEFGT
jgi:hypothetical protein